MAGDLGAIIALSGLLAGIGVLAGAFAGAYFFGKSRGQRDALSMSTDPELMARVARIEQIVETTAIEIERITEGQRFTTKLLSEKTTVES
jgi:proteasome assembly chaperone (PAC2) family protein